MPKTVTRKEIVERRTYIKGRFIGKLSGDLDKIKSDLVHENFFDLDFLTAEIFTESANIRKWNEGGEFEEFVDIDMFPSVLPNPINCNISYDDGSVKHFSIQLHEPKLKNFQLDKQLYEKEVMFVTLEGEIGGYLKHFDTEKYEEILPDEPKSDESQDLNQSPLQQANGEGGAPVTNESLVNTDPCTPADKEVTQVITSDPAETVGTNQTMHTFMGRMLQTAFASKQWNKLANAGKFAATNFPRTTSWIRKSFPINWNSQADSRGCAHTIFEPTSNGCANVFIFFFGLYFVGILFWALILIVGSVLTAFGSLLLSVLIPVILIYILFSLSRRVSSRWRWIVLGVIAIIILTILLT